MRKALSTIYLFCFYLIFTLLGIPFLPIILFSMLYETLYFDSCGIISNIIGFIVEFGIDSARWIGGVE